MTAKGLRAPEAEPSGPLAKRDELQRQKQNAYDEYAEQTQKRQRAERERGAANRKLSAVESARATGGGSDAQVEKVAAEVASTIAAYEEALARGNRALETTKSIEATLAQLYGDEFPAFAEEAEQVSKRADAAVNELVDAYRRAQEAWAAAQVAWGPLAHAVRIAPMEPFPLTDHAMEPVITGWDARPVAIEVLDVSDDEAIEVAAEMEGLNVAG